MNAGIIVAAGRSERMGGNVDKAFLSLGSRPVLAYSLMAFEACPDIDEIILVVRREQQVAARGVARMFGCAKLTQIVAGGARRQDSVRAGLGVVHSETRMVAVHDGARPLVTSELISATIKTAKRHGCAVAAQRMLDTVKVVERGTQIDHTLDRGKVWTVQTPQTFKLDILLKAFEALEASGETVTDESSAVERIGEPVRLVDWPRSNLKITTADDLCLAAALLKA